MTSKNVYVILDTNNSTVNANPVQYNLEAIIDLNNMWQYIVASTNKFNRIFVQTTVSIPVLKNNTAVNVDLSLINYYDISSITDRKIVQYGYYEGNYDDTRSIVTTSSVWCYTMVI